MDLKLNGKVIFVTGGSRGIGREIVRQLLLEGAYVGTCARQKGQLDSLKGGMPEPLRENLYTEVCDVRELEQIEQAVAQCAVRWGGIDGVVANAGFGTSGNLFQTKDEEWLSQYELKLLGVTNLVNAALPYIRRSDSGRIVVMNGVTAEVPDPNMAAVSAARAAVKQVIRLYAEELAEAGICVNAVNIGAIETGRQISRYNSSGSDLPYDQWMKAEAARRKIPFRRLGKVEEVAPAVLFLLSPLASYITGSGIDVAGGLGGR